MLIYIGADHRGFKLKESLKSYLRNAGYEVVDVGNSVYDKNDDYPDFAKLVAEKVQEDPNERRGVVICGSGVGVSVAANKFERIRVALVISPDQAAASKSDEDTNVISFAADYIDEEDAKKILSVWLAAKFSGADRHVRRLGKIAEIEKGNRQG